MAVGHGGFQVNGGVACGKPDFVSVLEVHTESLPVKFHVEFSIAQRDRFRPQMALEMWKKERGRMVD